MTYLEYWLCEWSEASHAFEGAVRTRWCVSDEVALETTRQVAIRQGVEVGCWWASPRGLIFIGRSVPVEVRGEPVSEHVLRR